MSWPSKWCFCCCFANRAPLSCSAEQGLSFEYIFDRIANFKRAVAAIILKKVPKKHDFGKKDPCFGKNSIKMWLFMQNFAIFTKKIPIHVLKQTNWPLNLIKTGLQPNKNDIFIRKVILGHIYSKKYFEKYHFFGIQMCSQIRWFCKKRLTLYMQTDNISISLVYTFEPV